MNTRLLATTACLALLLFCSGVEAQVGTGVEVETDEFTGEISCSQLTLNASWDPTGVALQSGTPGMMMFVTHAIEDWAADSAFSLLGNLGGERVYFKFGDDDVIVLAPDETGGELASDYEYAAFMIDDSFVRKLLSAPRDIRVRFDGPDGLADFTINHAVVLDLAQGFGQTCLGAVAGTEF